MVEHEAEHGCTVNFVPSADRQIANLIPLRYSFIALIPNELTKELDGIVACPLRRIL